VSLQNIRVAVEHLRRRGIRDLAGITLFSDGTTVYECASPEEVVDLLRGGQGVFGIAVSGAMREITGSIKDFPVERADGGTVDDSPRTSCPAAGRAAPSPDRSRNPGGLRGLLLLDGRSSRPRAEESPCVQPPPC
jgi:hypothetical protein